MLCLSGLAAADVQAELTEEQVMRSSHSAPTPVEDCRSVAAQARALKEKAERYLADCQSTNRSAFRGHSLFRL